MLMELITVTGGNRSNSFVTVAEADFILSEHTIVDSSAWTSLSESSKTERLLYAGLILKNRYTWLYWPVYKSQGMPFPRWYVNEGGETVYVGGGAEPAIPENIKKAQTLIALNVAHRGSVGLSAPTAGKPAPSLKSLSLFGSLDVTLADTGLAGVDRSVLAWMIDELLREYLAQARFHMSDSNQAPSLLDEIES
jgi:hypothetical protein